VEIGIINTELIYDVHIKLMKRGPKGTLHGSVTHITCDVQLCLVPGSEIVVLEKLKVKDIGNLKAKFTGLGSMMNFLVSQVSFCVFFTIVTCVQMQRINFFNFFIVFSSIIKQIS